MFIKNYIFSLLITFLQITLITSVNEKCYSIKNCATCPELDICEQCLEGFIINKSKTKCKDTNKNKKAGEKSQKKEAKEKTEKKPEPSPPPKKEEPQPNKPSPSPLGNPFLQKPMVSVNKVPNNPFQNIPTPSFQRFKEKEANNALINKILIFILIVLILSIIISVINNFLKKNGRGESNNDEEGQEIASSNKVVYIH